MNFFVAGTALFGANLPDSTLMVNRLLPGSILAGFGVPLASDSLSRHLAWGPSGLHFPGIALSAIWQNPFLSVPLMLTKMLAE